MQSRTTGPPYHGQTSPLLPIFSPLLNILPLTQVKLYLRRIPDCELYILFSKLFLKAYFMQSTSLVLYIPLDFYVSCTWHAEQPQKPQRLCVCRYIANETLNFTNTAPECPHTYCNNKVKIFWKVFHQNSIIWTLAFILHLWQAYSHWEEKCTHHHCFYGTHSIWDEHFQY